MRALAGLLLGLVARAWLATLRVHVEADPRLDAYAGRPWVFAFFHGTQWPLLAWRRRRRTLVMVSWSRDGALQSRALGVLGFSVVRGSSSRGGARGLTELLRRVRREGADAAFAVDGPRGPYGVAKGGARSTAQAAGGVVVPMGAAVTRGARLWRAWDRFIVAWPFSRVVITLGPAIDPAAGHAIARVGDSDGELSAAVTRANQLADARATALWGRPRPLLPWPPQVGGALDATK